MYLKRISLQPVLVNTGIRDFVNNLNNFVPFYNSSICRVCQLQQPNTLLTVLQLLVELTLFL